MRISPRPSLSLLFAVLLGACTHDPGREEPPTPTPADAGPDALPVLDAAADAPLPDAEVPDVALADDAPADAAFATLILARTGDGEGVLTSAAPALDCGADCTATLPVGTEVVLSAAPAPGSQVGSWDGPCASVGTAEQCSFVLDRDRTISVAFERTRVPVVVEVVGPGGGRVQDDQGLLDCAGTCTASYLPSTPVTLTATSTSGPFHGWTGDCTATGTACSLVADGARAVRAVFGHLAVVTALPFGDVDDGDAAVGDMLVGPDGDLYVTGYHTGGHLGPLPLSSAGQSDIVIARIDGTTGQPEWVRSFGGSGFDWGSGLGLRGDRLYVAAAFVGTVDLGDGPVTASDTAVALLTLGLDGEVERTQTIVASTGQGRLSPTGLDVTADGVLIVGGNLRGTVDFGRGAGVISSPHGMAEPEGWVLALDADLGTPRWLRPLETTGSTIVGSVEITGAGDVVIGGEFDGSIDPGEGPIVELPATVGEELFVAKLRGADGAHVWSRGLGGPGLDFFFDAAVDGDGNVYLGGVADEHIDLGGGWVIQSPPNGGSQDFVARLHGETGAAEWAFPVSGNPHVDVLDDRVLVSGSFHSFRLSVRDRTTGAIVHQRDQSLNGNAHSYRAILAGDHAWGVLDGFGAFSLDGLDGPNVGRRSWIIRIGL